MYNICEGFSSRFRNLINHLIYINIESFIEVGSNLDPEEIYYTVFPTFYKKSETDIVEYLNKSLDYFEDDFLHELMPFDEFVLYKILQFQYESTDDGFVLNEEVDNFIESNKQYFEEGELELLSENDIDSNFIIGLIFEDIDFLDVPLLYKYYKTNPKFLDEFAHVDLDYYVDLMPPDIRQEYLNNKKKDIVFNNINIETVEEFNNIVYTLVIKFRDLIVNKRGYKFLYNGNEPINENGVQDLFRLVTQVYEEIYDLDISPEVDTCRGRLDFKISRGSKYKAIIEFKLDSNSNVEEGIKFQLPLYMKTENSKFGVFVLVCYSNKRFDEYEKITELATLISDKYNIEIKAVRINACKDKLTGSVLKSEKDLQFEI